MAALCEAGSRRFAWRPVMATTGRLKSAETVIRQIRRTMNSYAPALSEKILAKALGGDSTAMLAASNMLLAANQQGTKNHEKT